MSNRLPWTGGDPRRLWQARDAFGVGQAGITGWWVHDTPVTTGRDAALATSDVYNGHATMIALAS